MSLISRHSRKLRPPACPACGDALPPTAQFCPGCGRAVSPLSAGLGQPDPNQGPRTDQPLTAAAADPDPGTASGMSGVKEVARFLPERYKPLRKLGQGGMGTVYQCMDQALERLVAIKIMTERYQSDPQGEKRFMREARAQAIVNHPNMATILNFGVSQEGRLFLVMEYLEGEDLRTIIRRDKAIDPLLACEYLAQICSGLEEAHAAGLIHRDLKPSNLMLVKDHRGAPRMKILDLGLAKIVGGQTDLKNITIDTAGLLIGTPAYMSPEQVAGSPVDGRADVYSIGVVFFEMLTGRLPFESETMEGWLYQHLHIKPPVPSKINAELARYPQLDAIVLCMLSKQPQDRPQSADLEKLMRRLVAHKLCDDKPVRKTALPFEDNPMPARKSGPRPSVLYDPAAPPPPDGGGTAPATAPPLAQPMDNELRRRREAFEKESKAAEAAETERRWNDALQAWQRALPFGERSEAITARIAACRSELDFEDELAAASRMALTGDWERTDLLLGRLASQRPADARLEQVRARLPRRLTNAWLAMAKTRLEALPEGDLRVTLMERLSLAYAQTGAMDASFNTLQETSRKIEARVVKLAQAIVAAIQNGQNEGLRPFLDRVSESALGLADPGDRGRALLEVGRAMAAYNDQSAAAAAFHNALSAFSEAHTRGIPIQVSMPKREAGISRRMTSITASSVVTTTNLGGPRALRSAWEAAASLVAQAQAESAFVEDSLATTALIEDPWTLAQTLSQVAQALAKTGRCAEAEKVAEKISFALPKAQAYRAVVVSRIYRNDLIGAAEVLKNVSNPADRASALGLLATAWALRNDPAQAEARLQEAEHAVEHVAGASGRFKAMAATVEPLLNAGFQELAQNLLDEGGKLVDLIDDPADRLQAMLQLAQLQENARTARLSATRTLVIAYQPSQALIDLLRKALVVFRQVRHGTDRFECAERLAFAIGSASVPALASEMLAASRDEAERALMHIGLSTGMA